MTEVLFYHLERAPLEAVLPQLLEKTLERGWKALVRVGSEERLRALDTHLWTWRDDAFLPHGTADQPHAADQPVLLTTGAPENAPDSAADTAPDAAPDNLNAADVLFAVDGAAPDGLEGFTRCVVIFDGRDAAAVARARAQWKAAAAAGHDVTYWQQNENGRWERKA